MKQEDVFYKQLLDNLFDGVYFVDREFKISYWNNAAERITGFNNDEMIKSMCSDNRLRHIDKKGTQLCEEGCPLHATLQDGKFREADELFLHHKDGHRVPVYIRIAPIKDEKGQVTGAVEIFSENSAKLETEKKIKTLEKKLALDNLTRLPNRNFMEAYIRNKLQEYKNGGSQSGLIFIDVDDFKSINDNYGHDVGDRLLKVIARTLLKNIRPVDMISRWGGEEFVLLFNDISSSGLKAVAGKMLTLVRHSDLKVGISQVKRTISIGGTLAGKEDSMESLVKRADTLMYQSKKEGKNRFTLG